MSGKLRQTRSVCFRRRTVRRDVYCVKNRHRIFRDVRNVMRVRRTPRVLRDCRFRRPRFHSAHGKRQIYR